MKKGNFTGWLTQVLPEKQMSEAFINSIFLAMSGGFQDAYTYFTRDKVFSNAQTGNVVLMSQHFMMGEWKDGLKYLLPLLAFAFGVLAAERIQAQFRFARRALAAGNSAAGNCNPSDCRISSADPQHDGDHSGVVLLCDAGAGIPEGGRLFLCQHDVHRQSAERYGVAFHVFQGAPSRVFEAGSLLFWHHPVFRTGRRGRRQLIGSLRGTCDLGIRRTSDGECAVNVHGKAARMEQVRTDRKGRV